ncbi:MAG: zinc-binding dehydrogenase [Firmicutes bacterium]|nr:zinc-binding dehydrogenase [Bacillota bacterium]
MKKVVVDEPRKVSIVEAEIPELEEGEALLKVMLGGVCGSDLGLYNGTMQGYATYPRVPGHEVAATIVKTCGDCGDIKEGDLVTLSPYIHCGGCYSCRRGLINCCVNNRTMGLGIDGVFAEYMKMPAFRLHKTEGLTPEETALVEPFCIGYHAAGRSRAVAGERALVVGAGTIGIFTMISLKLRGAEVTVANRNEARLVKARELGADHTFAYGSEEEFMAKVAEFTDGDGYDVVVDAVGDPLVFNYCFAACAHDARFVEVGINPKEASFPMSMLQKKEIEIIGSRNAVASDFKEVIEIIRSKKVDVNPVITAVAKIDDVAAIFEAGKSNKTALKTLIDFR